MTRPPESTPEPAHSVPSPELSRLHRQLHHLRLGVAALALVLGGTLVAAVRGPAPVEVLRAERLEIVEPDGSLAFVLTNSALPQVATIDGVPILAGQAEERRMPHFIFFDGQGDEVGGMTFSNRTTPAGGVATRHLSLDGYKQDQTVVLHHYQDARGTAAGLSVSDRPRTTLPEALAGLGLELGTDRAALNAAIMAIPEEERGARLRELFGGANRVFVGSSRDGAATLLLSDATGRPRIHLGVPAEGAPFIRILDEDGQVLWELPRGG